MQTASDAAPAFTARPARGRMSDAAFTAFCWAAGLSGIALPLAITGYLLVNGFQVLSWEFLTGTPRGYPLGLHGGIRPAIEGTLALTGLAVLISFPAALASAVFLTEYTQSRRFLDVMRFLAECLAAIPAILFGVFGYACLVVFFGFGISLLSGAVTLALMMYPVILIGSYAALQGVGRSLRESALSLGVSRSYSVRRIVLRKAWPGIVASVVLAAGHATGSAAPILFTAAVVQRRGPVELDAPVMALPTHLFNLVSEAVSFDHAYGTAFILILFLLLANSCALLLRRRLRIEG